MTKKQALNYLRSSGFSKEQIKAVVDALQGSPTKNDLEVDAAVVPFWDAISRQEAIDTIRQLYLDLASQKAVIDILKVLPSVTPQEPTTKNDLGVDAVSRQAALDACHNFAIGILDDYYEKCLKQWIIDLPSVTLIRPKGHWIWCGGSHKCSNCEEYTCFSHKVRYCPNCGSDNREVEDK